MRRKATAQKVENGRRRKATLIKKVHEFGLLFDVDIALLIKQKRQYSGYTSIENKNWPPPMAQIVSSY